MPAANTDMFTKVGSPGTATTLSAPGHLIGGNAITVVSTANYPTDTGVIFAMDTVTLVNGVEVRNVGTYTEWEGVVSGATSITSMTLRKGTDQDYPAGATTRVYIPVSASQNDRMVDGLLVEHGQDGKHTDITADSVASTDGTITNLSVTNLTIGSQTPSADWTTQATLPSSVVYNGNGSFTETYAQSVASIKSPGQRNKYTRTVTAPTQSTSLNGTNQYWVKTSPNKMTFTDDFTQGWWIFPTAYNGTIASRFNNTSGWRIDINTSGQIEIWGYNGGAGNYSGVISAQSVELNKWTHISGLLDMSAFTAAAATAETAKSWICINGFEVSATVSRGGTNPTALVQAGNLEIGSYNGGTNPFSGLIKGGIFNTRVTQATIRSYINQEFTGSETNLISAYSFNGVATDLNTTTPNDLTAQNSAGYVTKSPFTTQATDIPNGTTDYSITQSVSADGLTVVTQACNGCTIPTSGGIAGISYSGLNAPYGFPKNREKWRLSSLLRTSSTTTSNATYGAYINGGFSLYTPVGNWDIGWTTGSMYNGNTTTDVYWNISPIALTGKTQAEGNNISPYCRRLIGQAGASTVVTSYIKYPQNITSPSTYVMYTHGATATASLDGSVSLTEIFAENAYL